MSEPAAHLPIRRRDWLLAGIAALVAFIIPMAVVAWLDNPPPEVRVLATDGSLSTLIVDGDTRILVINTANREAAGAFLGRIAQPWEPRPATIIAPATDDAANGLWEVMVRLDPATIIVTGVPGADPLWSAIESEAARRRITLQYITDRATTATDRLALTIFGSSPDHATGEAVVVRRNEVSIVIGLGDSLPAVDGQALIHNGQPAPVTPDLHLHSDDLLRATSIHEILVDDLRATVLAIERDAIRVYGGALRVPS